MGGELDQEMLDRLMEEAGLAPDPPVSQPAPQKTEPVRAPDPPLQHVASPAENGKVPVKQAQFSPIVETDPLASGMRDLGFLMEVKLEISVELGRSNMPLHDILSLTHGSVIELDKVAGEPVDVMVNGTLIAKGEVVVVDEKFGVRVTEIVSTAKRVASLGGSQK